MMRNFSIILLALFTGQISAAELTLESYLSQVTESHEGYKAAKFSKHAAELDAHETHLLTAPFVFANANHTDDARPNLLFNYDKQISTNYQLGISQQTSIGLQGRLYYSWMDSQYRNLQFGGPPVTITGSQGSPTIELTLPIWRNLWGGETRDQIEQGDAATKAKSFEQSFSMKSILLQAESAYWALALARETVKVSTDALERAEKLFRWNFERSKEGLADRADVLQAEAARQSKKLELKAAEDDALEASRNFNSARGLNSAVAPESLGMLSTERLGRLQKPVRGELRDDTRAALERSRAAKANADAQLEKYTPTLEVFGSYALNNPIPSDTGNAFNDSFNGSRPTQTIGLRLNAPLDLSLIHDVRQGWESEKASSELSFRRSRFEQDSAWNNLSDKFEQAEARLKIYDQLQEAEKIKLEYERERRKRGRTTTQQVIMFESDYEQSQLGRLRTMSEILQLLAQMKTYGSTNESR